MRIFKSESKNEYFYKKVKKKKGVSSYNIWQWKHTISLLWPYTKDKTHQQIGQTFWKQIKSLFFSSDDNY